MQSRSFLWAVVLTAPLFLGACHQDSSHRGPGLPEQAAAFEDPQLARCVRNSPLLNVVNPADVDSSGTLEFQVQAGSQPAGPCRDNRAFRFGSGLYDITGPVANTGGMGWENPEQVFSGLHQRQYARAFAIESPCNGKRIMFVSTDTGMIFGAVRQAVLTALAADPALSEYSGDNLMLSATHTHSGPAGYSHFEAFNLFHFGFDQLVLDTIVDGIVEAIRRADANLELHPETAPIHLAVGELLNTNINRSLPAFTLNPLDERLQFTDAQGEPVEVDKRFVQLNLVRENRSPVGVINWFGVHPTVIGPTQTLVSSDNKGYASLGFERLMGTAYGRQRNGEMDNFVAAFAQTDEGDSSPNILIRERPHPDPTRGGGADDFESSAISGTKQLAKALELFHRADSVSGPVDYRLVHLRMDSLVVDNYEGPTLPDALNAEIKRTCTAALGPSFAAGAEDGPGPAVEGVDCSDDPADIEAAQQAFFDDFEAGTGGSIPPHLASTSVLCNIDQVPTIQSVCLSLAVDPDDCPFASELPDLSCHAEKPVLFAIGAPVDAEPTVLPLQLFRIGNVAILGLPWEVTTMAARRLRASLLDELAPVGVDTVIIAGLVNDYIHYLTTREEYSSQQYEGASNVFGPWTLAALRQESRKLARAMIDSDALTGPDYLNPLYPPLPRPAYVPSDEPGGRNYGDTVVDAPMTAERGAVVTARFQAGHPRNDLKLQDAVSYVAVERQQDDGSWQVVVTDRDPELVYAWIPDMPSPTPTDPALIGPSQAEVRWTIPRNMPDGQYRLRHEGVAAQGDQQTPYSGLSRAFTLTGRVDDCP